MKRSHWLSFTFILFNELADQVDIISPSSVSLLKIAQNFNHLTVGLCHIYFCKIK